MINRRMSPFFSSTLWTLFVGIFYFKTFKIQLHGVPSLHYVLVCNMHSYTPKVTLSTLLTQISFFYVNFSNFWYIKCFVPNLIPIWFRSRGVLEDSKMFRSLFQSIEDKGKIKFLSNFDSINILDNNFLK